MIRQNHVHRNLSAEKFGDVKSSVENTTTKSIGITLIVS